MENTRAGMSDTAAPVSTSMVTCVSLISSGTVIGLGELRPTVNTAMSSA